MRQATNGKYPRFALWENVPGAFSSNKGEDFRVVLEELIKIVEPTAVMPSVPKKGWAYADSYVGDEWSLAYRVFDAQYWGVPQRRRRIHLVVDFRGKCARKVLFERDGLRGYFAEGRTPWKEFTPDFEGGVTTNDREGTDSIGADIYNLTITGDKACGLTVNGCSSTSTQPKVIKIVASEMYENHSQDTRYRGPLDVAQTVNAHYGTGGNNQPFIVERHPFCKSHRAASADDATTWKEAKVANTFNTFDLGETRVNELIVEEHPIVLDRAFYNQGQNAQYDPQFYTDGTVPPLVARGPAAVQIHYIVRRLTPTECARLQGFADRWGDIEPKTELSDEEYKFWLDVRNVHAAINGKQTKDYTPKQMLTWYNKLQTDSAEYKMWGNGIALPPALYCMQGMAEVLYQQ
jgi:DNA (cytosine-5)-methyltransferase 1